MGSLRELPDGLLLISTFCRVTAAALSENCRGDGVHELQFPPERPRRDILRCLTSAAPI